ncbi:MAG: MraY family glycosyltransferase [Prevotellaceae bacterium]|nr:MraY family glycosyltransferase [Prevotellaceae bacterium]
MIWLVNSVTIFALSACLTAVLIPQILHIATRRKLYDIPNERKIHHYVVPRLGGVAFAPVLFFSCFLLTSANHSLGWDEVYYSIAEESLPIMYTYCAITMLYLVGMADDLNGIHYKTKFMAQTLSALLMIAGGVMLTHIQGNTLPLWISIPLTVLIIVFIINAVNLIDGIDGLASGLGIIAFTIYGCVFFYCGKYIYAFLSFSPLGILVPFFYYNVFGKAERGKKIFMGDTGSMTIGLLLSFMNIQMCKICNTLPNHINPVVLAFSPLLIPGLDLVRVFLFRIRHGKNPFVADTNHIHHKLMVLGITPQKAMTVIVSFSFVLTLLNIFLSGYMDPLVILSIDIIIWTVANIFIRKRIIQILSKNKA